ncbi:hypothetical protein HPB47_012211 [Ixodes persulcatus]|uniref:Uncharacterized protein n=1 Tax=Ixodes persulcatus TaxID=34615 RepID=A0AC60NUG0_IXOPE|nr:hypothetical protein HPB47_012211 [Ixodes persulcatus]
MTPQLLLRFTLRVDFLTYLPRFESAFRDDYVYGIARFVEVFDTDRHSDESYCYQKMLEAGHFDCDPLATSSSDDESRTNWPWSPLSDTISWMSAYRVAEAAIDDRTDSLGELGQFIWKNPELGFEETKAHDYIATYLESEGFQVTRNYILPTAFRAEFGGPGPSVAILCEYDALPGIGHACGHNLIAEGSVAVAVGVKAVLASRESTHVGRLVVLGTPAEENGSGKQLLIDQGAFKDLDVAMMVHPAGMSILRLMSIALVRDGCGDTMAGVTCGKQQTWRQEQHRVRVKRLPVAMIPPGVTYSCRCLLSGVTTNPKPCVIKRGGLSSNVIPDETEMEYRVRAPTTRELVTLMEKVKGCFLAAAEATGCTVTIDVPTPIVKHNVPNETLARVFQKHGESLGMRFIDADPADNIALGASTDAGNASHVLPLIHPLYDIRTKALNHSEAFTEAAGTEAGHLETLKAAKALCFTVLDVLGNEKLLKDIKEEFHAKFNSTWAEKK